MSVQPFETEEAVDYVAPLAPSGEELDELDLMWMERLARPWRPTERQPFRPVRCTGVTRNGPRAGRQCPHASVLGTNVCQVHGAQLPVVRKAAQARVEQARIRIINSADDAVEWLLDLGANSTSDAVRLKASTEILDRAGVRGGVEVDVVVSEEFRDPAELLKAKLDVLRRRTIEGQVIESRDTVTDTEPHQEEQS